MHSASAVPARTHVAARPGVFPWALAACALVATANVAAHEFCVETGSDLEAALVASSDGGMYAGENNDIELRPGTYTTSGGPFQYTNATRGLSIIGGYDAGCVNRLDDPTLSVLDGGHATRVLELHSQGGALEVDWMTIQNGESTGAGAGLYLEDTGGQATSVSDVARALGMTKAGLYHHFESKEALLFEIMMYGLERVRDEVIVPVTVP